MTVELTKTVFTCPHCLAKCQFAPVTKHHLKCRDDGLLYSAWACVNCLGLMLGVKKYGAVNYDQFYPSIQRISKIKLSLLPNQVRADFCEAITNYSYGSYVSTVIMCRRIIQYSCIEKGAPGVTLYEQIESMPIDDSMKQLAHNIRFWGNSGAHPDILIEDALGQDDAEIALDFTEKFLDFVYVVPAELGAIDKRASESSKEA